MGVLSSLPFVSAGNACCCLWVLAGGLVAAYVLQQNMDEPIAAADGAIVGLLAGVAGAFIQVLVAIPISMLAGPYEREIVRRMVDNAGNMPPELHQFFERYTREAPTGFGILARILALFFWLAIGVIFGTLGGLLGAVLFRKERPTRTIDVTPIPGS